MPSKLSLAGATAIGAGLAYFYDPDSGARRRNMLRDQLASKARSGVGDVAGTARDVAARASGAVAGATGEATEPANDQALADRVKSEVLGQPDIPKDRINVDVADGVVALRGEVEDRELMQSIDARVRAVAGVRDVQNLLHLPGEPVPSPTPPPSG